MQNDRRYYSVWESSSQSWRPSAHSLIKRSRTNIRRFSKERKSETSWGTRKLYIRAVKDWVRVEFICTQVTFHAHAWFLFTRLEERDVQVSYESKLKRKNQLLASRSNKLKRFGDHVPNLLGSIAEAYATGRFLKKPIGPIGDFLLCAFVWQHTKTLPWLSCCIIAKIK